jgi:hypothetical protein
LPDSLGAIGRGIVEGFALIFSGRLVLRQAIVTQLKTA